MFKKLLLPLAAVSIIAGLANAQDLNKTYLSQLEEAGTQMGYILTPKVRACMADAVKATPETLKSKASELNTVDVNILRRNGVSIDDVKVAFVAVKPCLKMLGVVLMP
jgi:hypothetical protein